MMAVVGTAIATAALSGEPRVTRYTALSVLDVASLDDLAEKLKDVTVPVAQMCEAAKRAETAELLRIERPGKPPIVVMLSCAS